MSPPKRLSVRLSRPFSTPQMRPMLSSARPTSLRTPEAKTSPALYATGTVATEKRRTIARVSMSVVVVSRLPAEPTAM